MRHRGHVGACCLLHSCRAIMPSPIQRWLLHCKGELNCKRHCGGQNCRSTFLQVQVNLPARVACWPSGLLCITVVPDSSNLLATCWQRADWQAAQTCTHTLAHQPEVECVSKG